MSFHPVSVEGFRHVYGRTPTVAQLRACIDFRYPPTPAAPVSNGCDCHDEECYVCDPTGMMNPVAG